MAKDRRKAMSEYSRARNAQRKADGICYQCGEPTDRPGKAYCSKCAEGHKVRRNARIREGLCSRCYSRAAPGLKHCAKHHAAQAKYEKDSRERKWLTVAARRHGVTKEGLEALWVQQDGKCPYCGEAMKRPKPPENGRRDRPWTGPEIDHKHPKARGGEDYLENLQWACRRCNE